MFKTAYRCRLCQLTLLNDDPVEDVNTLIARTPSGLVTHDCPDGSLGSLELLGWQKLGEPSEEASEEIDHPIHPA